MQGFVSSRPGGAQTPSATGGRPPICVDQRPPISNTHFRRLTATHHCGQAGAGAAGAVGNILTLLRVPSKAHPGGEQHVLRLAVP